MMKRWRVTMKGSITGSIGELHNQNRTVEVEAPTHDEARDAGIRAAIATDIEHIRVVSVVLIEDTLKGNK